MFRGTCLREDGERRSWLRDPMPNKWEEWKLGFFLSIIFFGFVKLVKFVIKLINPGAETP